MYMKKEVIGFISDANIVDGEPILIRGEKPKVSQVVFVEFASVIYMFKVYVSVVVVFKVIVLVVLVLVVYIRRGVVHVVAIIIIF